ncbi:MAG: hypothetical protein EZS28_032472 [Streblomastix strix]|uniref:Uncharacterized protein n=1 Tax=Streblomastix strix TaxID=222440 RepID=A0A5J4UPR0_9EUKA|nr:MAG: hypothetical protein EZS28_032472 [Streblomastix strix]
MVHVQNIVLEGTNYPSGCKCPTDSSQLVGIPSSRCQCRTIRDTSANADWTYLLKGDPRAGDVCPSYCISKAELTIECMCELGSSIYRQATYERDKLCIVDLIHQSISNCSCLKVDDPRGEQVCNQTDIDPADIMIPDRSEKDPENKLEYEDIIKQEEDEEEKQKEEPTTFIMIWINIIVVAGKTKNQSQEQDSFEQR